MESKHAKINTQLKEIEKKISEIKNSIDLSDFGADDLEAMLVNMDSLEDHIHWLKNACTIKLQIARILNPDSTPSNNDNQEEAA